MWFNGFLFGEHYAAGLQALANSKGLPADTTNKYIDHIMPDLWGCLHEAKDTVVGTLMSRVSDQAVAGFIDLVAKETLGYTIYHSMVELETGEPPQQKTVSYTKASYLDEQEVGYFTFHGRQHVLGHSHWKSTRYTLSWDLADDLQHIDENANQVLPKHDEHCFNSAVCKSMKEEDSTCETLTCNPESRCGKMKLEPRKSDPDVKAETDYLSTSHTLSDIPVKSGHIKKEPGVDYATK